MEGSVDIKKKVKKFENGLWVDSLDEDGHVLYDEGGHTPHIRLHRGDCFGESCLLYLVRKTLSFCFESLCMLQMRSFYQGRLGEKHSQKETFFLQDDDAEYKRNYSAVAATDTVLYMLNRYYAHKRTLVDYLVLYYI